MPHRNAAPNALFEQCRAQADAAVGGEYGERCDEQPLEEPAVGAFHPCPGEHDVCDGPLLAGRHKGEFRNVVPAVAQPGGEILFRPAADRRCFESRPDEAAEFLLLAGPFGPDDVSA